MLGIKEADAMQAAVVASWLQVVLGVEGCWGNPLKGMCESLNMTLQGLGSQKATAKGCFLGASHCQFLGKFGTSECQSCCPLDGSSEAGQMVRGYPPVSSNVAACQVWLLSTGTTKCYGAVGCHCKLDGKIMENSLEPPITGKKRWFPVDFPVNHQCVEFFFPFVWSSVSVPFGMLFCSFRPGDESWGVEILDWGKWCGSSLGQGLGRISSVATWGRIFMIPADFYWVWRHR